MRHYVRFGAHGVRFPVRAGASACGKGAVRGQSHVHLPAYGYEFAFVLAVKRIVVVLHGGKRRPAVVACGELHIVELVSVHRGSAQRAHFARFDQLVQGFHRFFDGSAVVETVDNVKVEIIRAQTPESAFYFAFYRLCGKRAFIEVHFRRQNHFVARDVALYRSAQIFFACAGGIAVRRIEKVDSQIKRVSDNRFALVGVESPCVHLACGVAEAHAPQTQARYFNAAVS